MALCRVLQRPHGSCLVLCSHLSLCLEGVTALCHPSWGAPACARGLPQRRRSAPTRCTTGAMLRLRPLKDSCPHWHRLATSAVSWRPQCGGDWARLATEQPKPPTAVSSGNTQLSGAAAGWASGARQDLGTPFFVFGCCLFVLLCVLCLAQ